MIAGTIATFGPLKSGELIAMEIYQQHHNIERGESLSVIVVGRIFDVVSVLILTILVIFSLPLSSISEFIVYLVLLTLILIVAIFVLLSSDMGMKVLALFRPLFRWKFTTWYDRLTKLAGDYYQSLELIGSSKRNISILFIFTISRWFLEVLFMYVLLQSFDINLTVLQIAPIVGLSYAIGVSSGTPGALGTFQLTAVTILYQYDYSLDLASLALLVGATLSIIINIVLGVLGTIVGNLIILWHNNQSIEHAS
jgi:uncharacterized protein (TIRG00374 family)